jgi:hypothetical protein
MEGKMASFFIHVWHDNGQAYKLEGPVYHTQQEAVEGFWEEEGHGFPIEKYRCTLHLKEDGTYQKVNIISEVIEADGDNVSDTVLARLINQEYMADCRL